ncbi:MAG: hypothetical protein M0R48_00805 [Candidatus Omnitrophica bacterium]|jgi:hypothetical protein|nr:hypothetical protein [Candidatus Omnitrophota bacterium]
MKWVSVILRAIILFLSFIALNIMFNLVMQIAMESWKNSPVALGTIPKAAVSLHLFIAQYTIAVGAIVLVFCFALPLITTARKK